MPYGPVTTLDVLQWCRSLAERLACKLFEREDKAVRAWTRERDREIYSGNGAKSSERSLLSGSGSG
jgi:hypothetical protein